MPIIGGRQLSVRGLGFQGAGRPSQTTGLSATNVPSGRAFNNGRIDLSWTAPANNGAPITGYFIERSTNSGSSWSTLISNTGTTNVTYSDTGLTSNTRYDYRVSAINAVGTGLASSAANATATTVPSTPTIGTATAGNASASVTFTASSSNGGSTITGYTATSSPGSITGTSASSPISITGLSNGTAYTFTVKANNANGSSASSAASNSVTPVAPPFFPGFVGPFFPFFTVGVPYGSCFNEDTLISTPSGLVQAKDIQIGDVVHALDWQELSTDENAMPWQAWEASSFNPIQLVETTITNTAQYERSVVINLNGDLITPEHPVLVKSNDTYTFKTAGDITLGEFILRRGGENISDLIWDEVISNDIVEGNFNVYLFSAEDYDVIFAQNHLSHNK